jgi:hypothetical protein
MKKRRLIDRIWEVLEDTFPDAFMLAENFQNQEGIVVGCKPVIEGFITEKIVMGIVREVINKQKISIVEDMNFLMPDRMIILADGRLVTIKVFAPEAKLKDLGALVIMINIG